MTKGEPFELEHRVRREDGGIGWTFSRAVPVRGGDGRIMEWFGMAADVTARREAEEALRASEAFMASVLSASTDCIKVLELDGSLSFMSDGGQRIMEVGDFNAIAGCPWPDFWQGEGNADAVAAIEAARRGEARSFVGSATTMKGTPKWWHVAVSPISGADGRPARILSVSRDITELRASEEERDRFRRLAENSTDFVAMAHQDGTVFYINDAGRRMVGLDGEAGPFLMPDFFEPAEADRNAAEVLPAVEQDGQWIGEFNFRHFQTGEAIPTLHSVFAIPDTVGNRAGYGTVTRDFRDHKRIEEQQRLLNGELAHRIKNLMSVVHAIAFQTLGKVADREAVTVFENRLAALSRSHDVLTGHGWSTTTLCDLVRNALATFGADRFRVTGPDVAIGQRAALSLSLMLHELATNAVKYGALSVPDGNVLVNWALRQEGDEQRLELNWAERGGPPATEPTRKGFGSRVIRMGLTGSGGVDVRYGATGLTVKASAPLYQVQEA